MSVQRRKITYQLYPSPEHAVVLSRMLASHQQLYNAALEERISAWRAAGKSISYEDQTKSLTEIRNALPEDWAWLNCSSQQVTLRRLNKAFQAFFLRCRNGQAVSRKKRGSKCWRRACKALRCFTRRQANLRKDQQHQLSARLPAPTPPLRWRRSASRT